MATITAKIHRQMTNRKYTTTHRCWFALGYFILYYITKRYVTLYIAAVIRLLVIIVIILQVHFVTNIILHYKMCCVTLRYVSSVI